MVGEEKNSMLQKHDGIDTVATGSLQSHRMPYLGQ